MRRTQVTTVVLALLAATALPGCAPSPSSGGAVTIQMVESLTNPARTTLLKSLIADFEKANSTIKVQLVSPPTDQADNKLQQMLQAGSGIDVLEVRDSTVGPWSTNKWLYDMNKDPDGWSGWQDLTENAKNAAKDDKGRTYFVPYGFYGLSLFYRTDMTKNAGFAQPPGSWEELLTQATAIQNVGKRQYGYAFRGGIGAMGNVTAIIGAYVADRIDKTNAFKTTDGKTIFAAPEATAALDTYFKLFKQASPPSSVAWGYPEMVEGFSNGSTAFLLQDPEVIETVGNSKAIKADQWSTAPLPAGPSGKAIQPLATAGWGVAESSKHKAEAVKFVQFLSSGATSTTFSKKNSLVPIQKKAGDDAFYKTGAWASYVTMTNSPDKYLVVTQPRGAAWWTEWQQKSDSEIQSVLLGKMTPAQLLTSWDTYWTGKWKTS
jgi:multiple sugar transport system substrate-binding protein